VGRSPGEPIRKSDQMKSLANLKGKVLAVNGGTIFDTWATESAANHGFEVQRYDNFPRFGPRVASSSADINSHESGDLQPNRSV
jgi:ABC-type amino acid transport substrate-binding protein